MSQQVGGGSSTRSIHKVLLTEKADGSVGLATEVLPDDGAATFLEGHGGIGRVA